MKVHLILQLLSIISPGLHGVVDPKSFMQVHKLRFHQCYIDQVHQVAEVIHGHPHRSILRGLVREGGTKDDAPGIVSIAEGHKQKPADIATT